MVRRLEAGSVRRLATIENTVSESHPRSPAVAEGREVLVEAQATEVGPDRRCGTEARRALAGQLPRLEPVPLRVGTKRPDDPVYLPARAQLGDLAEAQERAVGVAAILPDGLDERKVLVGLVATATNRPLHEHNHILQHCKSDVVDVSPLHSRSKVRTYPQLAQVIPEGALVVKAALLEEEHDFGAVEALST